MFQLGQIFTASQLLKNFRKILSQLEIDPQPILITQRNGAHMVLVNAEIWQETLAARLKSDGLSQDISYLKDIVLSSS